MFQSIKQPNDTNRRFCNCMASFFKISSSLVLHERTQAAWDLIYRQSLRHWLFVKRLVYTPLLYKFKSCTQPRWISTQIKLHDILMGQILFTQGNVVGLSNDNNNNRSIKGENSKSDIHFCRSTLL